MCENDYSNVNLDMQYLFVNFFVVFLRLICADIRKHTENRVLQELVAHSKNDRN